MEIFRLFGSILIPTDNANKSLDSIDKKGQGLAKTLGSLVGTAAKVGAGIAAGVGTAGAAMLGVATKTAAYADEIDKLSERTGINREELQRWKYAAGQSGADISKLEVGIKKLSDAMDDATNGSEKNIDAFKRLGISLDDLKNKSQEQIFEEVMYALAEMPQGAERNALGNDLLGKSYTELLPLLNAGAAGMDDLKKRADELGIVMSEDSVKAGVQFGDTMDDLKQVLGAVFNNIGTQLIPVMQSFMDWIIAHMPEIKATFETVFGVINTIVMKAFEIFNDYIKPVLISVYGWVQDNMPMFKAIFENVFGAVWNIVSRLWHILTDDLLPIFKALYEFVAPTFPILGDIIKGAFDTVIGIVNGVIDVFETLVGWIKTAIEWIKQFNRTDIKQKNIVAGRDTGALHGIAGFAAGTNDAPGGWAVVGEKGPELMYVPKHSKIIPNNEIGGIGGTHEITVNIPVTLEGKVVTNVISKIQFDNTRGRARAIGVSV